MRYVYALMWAFLVVEGVFFAPTHIDTEQLWNMIMGQYEGINPALVSLFMMMGLHPMLCAAYLWEYKSKPSYIPFCMGSFFLGCFALLPFLFFRSIQHRKISFWTSANLPSIAILIGFVFFLAYGMTGDISSFHQTFQEDNFVHIMSLDFLVFVVVASLLSVEDGRRYGKKYSILALIPLFGPLIWLCIRKEEDLVEHSPS